MAIDFVDRPSPNHGERVIPGRNEMIKMLVIHYTGMKSAKEALDRLCDPHSQVSAHILIDEDGTAYRLVADERRAWHAGHAFWRGTSDVNSASIGVELVNPGHEHGYRDFPDNQINALIDVCLPLISKYNIQPAEIVGHSDVAPGRKQDPGERFPWERLCAAGIGLWPSFEPNTDLDGTAWDELAAIGYAKPGDEARGASILDPETAESDVISAFQRRFLPQDLTGTLDDATRSHIGLVRKTYSKSLI